MQRVSIALTAITALVVSAALAVSAFAATKTVAVKEAGASYFLVPKNQEQTAIDEAKGSSLKVIGVSTVAEALKVLEGLGGDVSGIPKQQTA